MNNNNSVAQIQNNLATVARELQLLAELKSATARELLSYQDALGKVESAITALDKLNYGDSLIENLIQPPQPKKSLMAKLKEIKIEGEPNWSQRCNGEIL